MKKLFLSLAVTAAAVLGFSIATQAQLTGTTTLHVKIIDALSITVNDANVTLTFANANDYVNGRDTTLNNHLTVTSNQAYDVKVKSASTNLTSGANNIATNSVTVSIPAGQSLGGTTAPAALTTTDQTIISAGNPVTSQGINVEYEIPSSISTTSAILGKPAGDYTTTLTYTIAAH